MFASKISAPTQIIALNNLIPFKEERTIGLSLRKKKKPLKTY